MRIEFSGKTKRILAGRAGYRCSFPDCTKVTIGPGLEPSEIISTGTAAHIYSVSDGDRGPRGTGGLSNEERRAPQNGIWLCSDHARLVDANRGSKYPASRLLSYKSLHEAKIAAEQGDHAFFWIEEICVHRSPIFRDESYMRLGKVTLLAGNNGTGKTQMLRCLSAISRTSQAWARPATPSDIPFVYTIVFRNPVKHILRVERYPDRLLFELDGKVVLFNPLPVEIAFSDGFQNSVSLEEFLERERRNNDDVDGDSLDDLNLLASYLEIDPRILQNLVPYVGTFVDHLVDKARIVVKNGRSKLIVNDKKWKMDAPLHKISGGMLAMLSMDILIARAKLMTEYMPTALLLQLPKLQLAPDILETYASYLSSPSIRFQTILETPHGDLPTRLPWLGWEITYFSKDDDDDKSVIQQD